MSDGGAGLTPYEKLTRAAFAKAIPMNCQIEITFRCNHLCTFCYNSPSGQRAIPGRAAQRGSTWTARNPGPPSPKRV